MPARARTDDFDDGDDADGEGPSPEDVERFSGEDASCPDCGAAIWDDAAVCPRCGAVIDGDAARRRPSDSWWRTRWFAVLVIVLVLAMIGLLPIMLRRGP